MIDDKNICKIFLKVIETYNAEADAGSRLPQTLDIALVGPEATLSSLGLINITLALESAVNEEFGINISLTDEDLISNVNGPFRTLRTLAQYIQEKVK